MSGRGDRYTIEWKKPEFYSDFLLDFSLNPTTGNLATVTNEDSISQAIRFLVLTMNGEVPGKSEIGSKVMGSLFGNRTPLIDQTIINSIEETIRNCEPRASNVRVTLNPIDDENSISITIEYQPINIPQTVSFSFIIRRNR
jgi:phage baseplate assembly protein W